MKIKLLMGLIIVLAMIATLPLPGHAVSSGNLTSLGYVKLLAGDETTRTGSLPFALTAPSGDVITQISFMVPYNVPGSTLYYNLQMTDGTTHKGSYQCIDRYSYTIYMDGTAYNGRYEYSLIDQGEQLLGLYSYNMLDVEYCHAKSDPSSFALFIISKPPKSPYGDTVSPGLLLPLAHPTTDIRGFSATCTNDMSVGYDYGNQTELIGSIMSNAPPTPETPTADLSNYIKVVEGFVDNLILLASGIIPIVLLLLQIFGFLLNPLNDIMILMQFEGLTAIMALSGKGDVLKAMERWLRYNKAMLEFTIIMAKGAIQIASMTIQGIALAVQAAAQIGQMGINALAGLGGWLMTLIAIIPK